MRTVAAALRRHEVISTSMRCSKATAFQPELSASASTQFKRVHVATEFFVQLIIFHYLEGLKIGGDPGNRRFQRLTNAPPALSMISDAAIDAQHARIGPEARDGVFGHVAVAAEQLRQAGVGNAAQTSGGVQVAHSRLRGEFAALAGGHAGIQKRLGGGDVAGALGQREAGVLELANRLAKCLAFCTYFTVASSAPLAPYTACTPMMGAFARHSRIICKALAFMPPSRASAGTRRSLKNSSGRIAPRAGRFFSRFWRA